MIKLKDLLMESSIMTNVKFIDKALEVAKRKMERFGFELTDRQAVDTLSKEFNAIRSNQFEGWEFTEVSKRSNSARNEAVYLYGANGDNEGIVEVLYNPEIHKAFAKDFKYWKVFKDVFRELVAHELTHIGQYDKVLMKYKNDPKKYIQVVTKIGETDPSQAKKYMSNKLELMAFAKQSVEEFKSHGFSDEAIEEYLKKYYKADINDSYIFYAYVNLFDKGEKPLKTFLKYIYSYIVK